MRPQTKRKLPLTDIQRLAQRVEAYRLPSSPFDYATRAQSMNDVRDFFHEIVREAKQYHAAPEATRVIEAARRLYYAASEAAYPSGFREDCQRLRAGDSEGLEAAVAFLEADPWFHRSGYVKDKLIRHIKPPMLTPEYIRRLQNVILEMVERRNGQEFQAYCKLARKVDAPDLREQLMRRMNGGDADTSRRARWVLEALAQKDSTEKRL